MELVGKGVKFPNIFSNGKTATSEYILLIDFFAPQYGQSSKGASLNDLCNSNSL